MIMRYATFATSTTKSNCAFLFDRRQDAPLAALDFQFPRCDPVERYYSVIASLVRLHFDGYQCRVSSIAWNSSQKFKVLPMFWSLANKAWVQHDGFNETQAERIVFRMVD